MTTYRLIMRLIGSMSLTFGLIGFYTYFFQAIEWTDGLALAVLSPLVLLPWLISRKMQILRPVAIGTTIGVVISLSAFPMMSVPEDLMHWDAFGIALCALGIPALSDGFRLF